MSLFRRLRNALTLFTSLGTLVCCAIPSLIAAIAGVGAVISLASTFPILVTISYYKGYVFLVAAAMLKFNLYTLYKKPKVCPIDAKEACEDAQKLSKGLTWFSVGIFAIGFTAAYIWPLFI